MELGFLVVTWASAFSFPQEKVLSSRPLKSPNQAPIVGWLFLKCDLRALKICIGSGVHDDYLSMHMFVSLYHRTWTVVLISLASGLFVFGRKKEDMQGIWGLMEEMGQSSKGTIVS